MCLLCSVTGATVAAIVAMVAASGNVFVVGAVSLRWSLVLPCSPRVDAVVIVVVGDSPLDS